MIMKSADLILLLERTIHALRTSDSFEGRIHYTFELPGGAMGNDTFEVDAFVRVGNSEGQGGALVVAPSVQLQGDPSDVIGPPTADGDT